MPPFCYAVSFITVQDLVERLRLSPIYIPAEVSGFDDSKERNADRERNENMDTREYILMVRTLTETHFAVAHNAVQTDDSENNGTSCVIKKRREQAR